MELKDIVNPAELAKLLTNRPIAHERKSMLFDIEPFTLALMEETGMSRMELIDDDRTATALTSIACINKLLKESKHSDDWRPDHEKA